MLLSCVNYKPAAGISSGQVVISGSTTSVCLLYVLCILYAEHHSELVNVTIQ